MQSVQMNEEIPQNEFKDSFFWQKPKIINQICLNEGHMINRWQYSKNSNLHDFSSNGKYFVQHIMSSIQIIHCIKKQIQIIAQYKDVPKRVSFTKDSNYLIIEDKAIIIFKEIEDAFKYLERLEIKSNIFNYYIKGNKIYIIESDTKCNIYLQTHNIDEKQSKQLPLKFYCNLLSDARIFPVHNYFIFGFRTNKLAFIYNTKGKRIKTTKSYHYVESIFGLCVESSSLQSYKLYYAANGKLIKHYKFYSFRYLKSQIKMNIFQNDVLIQWHLFDQFMDGFYYQLEIKCLKFELRQCKYRGLNTINKNGAFKIQGKDSIMEFYLF